MISNIYMKFKDFEYVRPQMDVFTKTFQNLLEEFDQAKTFAEQDALFGRINEMRTEFSSMHNICHIRHTIDTKDEFYEEENNFYDKNIPNFQALNTSPFIEKSSILPFEMNWSENGVIKFLSSLP